MGGWWHTGLEEFSPLAIILTGWAPILISVIIGGLFASIIFPRWQDRHIVRKAFVERRQAIIEEVAELLNAYTNIWRRLIQISIHETDLIASDADTSAVVEKKMQFVARRTEVHDELMACLSRVKIYVNPKQRDEIKEFVAWAESMSTLRLDELPEISAWRDWEDRLLSKLQSHLQ